MSTTFDVYPSREEIPSFARLLEAANGHLSSFLQRYNIMQPVRLDVAMRPKDDDNHTLPFDRNGPAWWPDDQYAWFFVSGMGGGTDAYAFTMDDQDRECVMEEIAGEGAARVGDLRQ